MAAGHDHVSIYKRGRGSMSLQASDMTTMRIAVAGTGGLALRIAYQINEHTSHNVVLLSRSERPELSDNGLQVAPVDYGNERSLVYALLGIDIVISTVTGIPQLRLIEAAVVARVRHFAPAEFEGKPPQSLTSACLADLLRLRAREKLDLYRDRMNSTIFVCGILYENFAPDGLAGVNIGRSSGMDEPGSYIIDCATMSARIPVADGHGQSDVSICMTAANDVARFVTKALDIQVWPAVMYMCGQRLKVNDLVRIAEAERGRPFHPTPELRLTTLRATLQATRDGPSTHQNAALQARLSALIKTAEGCYDYDFETSQQSLNRCFPDMPLTNFQTWFHAQWNARG